MLELPQTLTAVVLVLMLPLSLGSLAGLFLRPVLRSIVLLLVIVAIGGVALLLAGMIQADVARGHVGQLWNLAGEISGASLRHLFDALAAYPVAMASFIIGLVLGILVREAWVRRGRTAT